MSRVMYASTLLRVCPHQRSPPQTYTALRRPYYELYVREGLTFWKKEEGNVLFNDALNTFYLKLHGVRHMVKNHSDRERETRCRHIG